MAATGPHDRRDDETSCVKPRARHGCAGARPSDGGCGGPYRGPPPRSMSPTRRALLAVLAVALVPGRAAAQLDELLKQLPQLPGGTRLPIPQGGALGEVKIGEALKQALQIG